MAFKNIGESATTYENPQALFRDLRNRKIQDIWGPQDKMLESYMKFFDSENLALEMPTGSGKTLVGLLIAEFRRRTKNEKVVYLCPTRQLVNQVVEQAKIKYGIEAIPFVGSRKNYSSESQAKYRANQAIAVTAYSSLFNSNPFFGNADVIICDDAHSCENYIGKCWSIDISRYENETLYKLILNLIRDILPEGEYEKFISNEPLPSDLGFVDMVAQPLLQDKFSALHDIIRNNINMLEESISNMDNDEKRIWIRILNKVKYPFSFIGDNLEACQIFISYKSILIRPLISPALTHNPFSLAKQRIYMSATLGKGGELERITGIPKIDRLPIIDGWDKQGLGRRFFIFPEAVVNGEKLERFVVDLCQKANRTLFLTQDDAQLQQIKELVTSNSNLSFFDKTSIEQTKETFTKTDSCVLALANRLDGIDLCGDDCRFMVLLGAPEGVTLQERFFTTALASSLVFRDRVRTRLVQALGRCNRDAVDYSAVCILGDSVTEELTNKNTLKYYHPELQAELNFGYLQSVDSSTKDMLENFDTFIEHGDEWACIDAEIIKMRSKMKQEELPAWEKLYSIVSYEVEYQYAIWNKNYSRALDMINLILNKLSGSDVKGYRGYWIYLKICVMYKLFKDGKKEYEVPLRKDLNNVSACWPAVKWIHSLESRLFHEGKEVEEKLVDYQVIELEKVLQKNVVKSNVKFEAMVGRVTYEVDNFTGTSFESTHTMIGRLSGFFADNSEDSGAPDPWWILNDTICLVFEDKIYDSTNNIIPLRHVREAMTHKTWICNKYPNIAARGKVYTIFLTNATGIEPEAAALCSEDIFYWNIEEFKQYTHKLLALIRNIRATYCGEGVSEWRESVKHDLEIEGIAIDQILAQVTSKLLKNL